MFHQPDASSDRSGSSSDTGDILIRSTRVRHGAGPGPGSVRITVQRVRDSQVQRPVAEEQPPEPRQKADRAAVNSQPDRRTLQKPTNEDRPPAAESGPDHQLCAGTHSQQPPGQDVLTSCFAAGGRGVVLAALKQRSYSDPHRKEVKVQLLDPEPLQTSSQNAPGLRSSYQDAVAEVQAESRLPADFLRDDANTAAALVKAQAVVEARMSQLADGVHQLLQADRERGWSLSQQTLHHLETLHNRQLQLQSQLLESALRKVTGHTSATCTTSEPAGTRDPTAAAERACLQVTDLDPAAHILCNRPSSSTAAETRPVATATPRPDRFLERGGHSRDLSVSSTTQPDAGSHLQSSANHTAARKANELLQEMGRLKSEMKSLLTPEESLKTTGSGSDHHQSQQNLLQSQQNPTRPKNLFQSKSQQTEPQQSQSHQSRSRQTQSHRTQSKQSQAVVQRRPLVPSMLEEAGQVLRQVQRQKKVLEENLGALLRAKSGEVLHCQLEALTANRDWTDQVRIKKTVDAWIDTLTKDIQAELSTEDGVTECSHRKHNTVTSQKRTSGSSTHTGRGQSVSMLRGTGSKAGRGRTAGQRPGAEPDRPPDSAEVDGESYLTRLYGRAPYEGVRRTLKKSPYLRFSSPGSPLSRKPRPRLVESVRGVKVKSCKTQTSLAPPLNLPPGPPQRHCIIGSSHLTSSDPKDIYTVPMAIPLGLPRTDSSSRCPAECQQEVTSPPTPLLVAMDDGTSAVQLQEEQLDAGEAPPPQVEILDRKCEEEEDKENILPGTDFVFVADVVPQEELSAVAEEVVQLDGGPSPPPVLYQGPVFPPQAHSHPTGQDQVSDLGLSQPREALENRMVEWVEQQLMSRMISERYLRPPSDPTQNVSTNQSESEEQSVTSDIVEAAGGGGLQLFVDSNTLVDSALIRQLVDEVLTEHVALMLGYRDAPETGPEPGLEKIKPNPGAHQEVKLVPLVPTPVPTPPASPSPPRGDDSPLTTPPPSEPTSLLNKESPPITAPEPVTTPTPSPEPALSVGSPPASPQAQPPLTWGDTELPLVEERPEEHPDTHTKLRLVPPLSSSPLAPSLSPPPPRPETRPSSPSSSPEDCSTSNTSHTSSFSSSVVTEAALKHISEGELLISVTQQAAMTEEEAVCSFSSSLQELQEMDFDPPSEGQVRGQSLLLSLVTKMEQGVTHMGDRAQPKGSWWRDLQEQEEDMSLGEVRDTTNPRRHSKTTAAGRQGQTASSPGQINQYAEVSEVSFEATNQGPVSVGDLQTDLSLSPPPQQVSPEPQTAGGGTRDVQLPFVTAEEEVTREDSSTDDVF